MEFRERGVTTSGPGVASAAATTAAMTVAWSGVWIGAFASVVAVVLFGFIGTALGAHRAGVEGRVTEWSGVGPGALTFAVLGAFFAFVIGGWVAVRLAGIRVPEHAALTGAVVFLVGTILLLALASQAAQYLNGWYSGLAPAPAAQPAVPNQPVDPSVAKAARNSAVAAAAVMLIGVIGGVIGGWAGSGERMTLRGMPRLRIETERRPA